MTLEVRMREDWNLRARDGALYWINTLYDHGSDDLAHFFEDGRRQAKTLTGPAFSALEFSPVSKSVLDIGCGMGRLLPGFADLGFSAVWGVDVSDEMIRRARQVCPLPQAVLIVGNGSTFPQVPSSSMDFCFSYNTLGHVPAMSVVWSNLRDILRVLRPGGIFQVHLRARQPLRRRLLLKTPAGLRPAAQALFHMVTLRHVRSHEQEALLGSQSTWEVCAPIPPHQAMQAGRRLGFTDIHILDDPTYPAGMRYWLIGRKPASS